MKKVITVAMIVALTAGVLAGGGKGSEGEAVPSGQGSGSSQTQVGKIYTSDAVQTVAGNPNTIRYVSTASVNDMVRDT